MDLILQQAIDRARREDLSGNFIGIVKALTGAFEDCDPSSEVYLCFELGKYYFAYGDMDSCIMMFSRAISGGFSKDAVDIFIARNFFIREQMQEIYLHNQRMLCSYNNLKAKNAPNFADIHEYCVFSNNACTVILGSDKKAKFIETEADENAEFLNDAIVFLVNETSIGRLMWLESQSRRLQKRKTPFYVFFSNKTAFWQMMTCMKIDTLLEEKRVVFFFSREEVDQYFSDTQTLLPDKIIERSAQGIGADLIETVTANREKRMQKAYDHVKKYYSKNSALIYSSIVEDKIKIFFYTTRFDQVVAQHVNNFTAAGSLLKYSVASTTEKSEFSSNGLAEYTMIERLQPNIIFAVNAFRYDKDRLPSEVIFITLIYDLESVTVADYIDRMTDNDYVLASSNVCKTLYSSGINKANIIEIPFLITEAIVDRNALRHIMYTADVCLFGDVINPTKLLQDIIMQEISGSSSGDVLMPQFEAAAKEINHLYLNLFYAEDIPFSLEGNVNTVSPVFEKLGISIRIDELESLAQRLRNEFCQQMYMVGLATSLIRGGIKRLRLWGSGWSDIPQLANYCIGAINDEVTLTKILANAAVVAGCSLDEPNLISIYNTVQCGGVYIENEYSDKKSKIRAMLNLNAEKDIIYFSDKADFVQKVRDCLADDQLRKKINASAKSNIKLSGAYRDVLAAAIERIQRNINAKSN